MPTINCRARLDDQPCLHGQPWTGDRDGPGPSEDGTWDGNTVICDVCYLALRPWTVSGNALLHELPDAILIYREQLAVLRADPRPDLLSQEAMAHYTAVRPDSPMARSTLAAMLMAEREVARRAARN